mmetsp:Transcript_54291/g.101967  ORF Transcript_54291/g.101967 Transcript_54291/m.101967 type:complete len:266 (-) Transcript_54291:200-997(-)
MRCTNCGPVSSSACRWPTATKTSPTSIPCASAQEPGVTRLTSNGSGGKCLMPRPTFCTDAGAQSSFRPVDSLPKPCFSSSETSSTDVHSSGSGSDGSLPTSGFGATISSTSEPVSIQLGTGSLNDTLRLGVSHREPHGVRDSAGFRGSALSDCALTIPGASAVRGASATHASSLSGSTARSTAAALSTTCHISAAPCAAGAGPPWRQLSQLSETSDHAAAALEKERAAGERFKAVSSSRTAARAALSDRSIRSAALTSWSYKCIR